MFEHNKQNLRPEKVGIIDPGYTNFIFASSVESLVSVRRK